MLDSISTLIDVVRMILSFLLVVVGIFILGYSLQRIFGSKNWKNKKLKKENRLWLTAGVIYILLVIMDILNGESLTMISSQLVLAICMLSFYCTEGE